jgi:Ca2+-binding EF-hand superfamily protein
MAEMFKALAEEDDEANKTAMEKAFMFWWDTLLEAGDGEPADKIGKQQFIGIMYSSVIEPETFQNAIGGVADGLIAALDTDGNGALSQEEYVRMYKALGIPPETSGEAFRRLDRDGSGEISNAEFRHALFEYYPRGGARAARAVAAVFTRPSQSASAAMSPSHGRAGGAGSRTRMIVTVHGADVLRVARAGLRLGNGLAANSGSPSRA